MTYFGEKQKFDSFGRKLIRPLTWFFDGVFEEIPQTVVFMILMIALISGFGVLIWFYG